MGHKNVETRAHTLVVAIAKKLASDTSLLDVKNFDLLLRQALADLPPGPVRTRIEDNFDRYAILLRQTAAQAASIEFGKSGKQLLEISKGPILTTAAFTKAVEAIVTGVEKEAGKYEESQEWVASCRKLIASRTNIPLTLWWAYSALELQSQSSHLPEGMERPAVIISVAKSLMDRLKSLSIGRMDDSCTEVAVLAPVVACVYDTATILSSSSDGSSKEWRKNVKSLRQFVEEVLGVVAVCNYSPEKSVETRTQGVDDSRGLAVLSVAVSKLTGLDYKEVYSRMFSLSPEVVRKSSTFVGRSVESWAGLMALEVFLLRLLLHIIERRGKSKATKTAEDLKFLAVHGISVLRTDFLLDLLMEPGFSFGDILNSDEEAVLRKALYEAILFDLPTYNKQDMVSSRQEFASYLKRLNLARRANEFYRSQNERTKAVEILSRVSMLDIPHGFLKWLQSSTKEAVPEDVINSSHRLSGWLAKSADAQILEKLLNRVCPQVKVDKTADSKKANEYEDGDELFFVDVKGEETETTLAAAEKALVAAAEDMKRDDENQDNDLITLSESSDDEENEEHAEEQRDLTEGVDPLRDSVEAVLAEFGAGDDLGSVQQEADVVMEEAEMQVEETPKEDVVEDMEEVADETEQVVTMEVECVQKKMADEKIMEAEEVVMKIGLDETVTKETEEAVEDGTEDEAAEEETEKRAEDETEKRAEEETEKIEKMAEEETEKMAEDVVAEDETEKRTPEETDEEETEQETKDETEKNAEDEKAEDCKEPQTEDSKEVSNGDIDQTEGDINQKAGGLEEMTDTPVASQQEEPIDEPATSQQEPIDDLATPAPRRSRPPRAGSKSVSKAEEPSTPKQTPQPENKSVGSVSRCTRSGRKYGDFTAPVEVSKKKRRL